MKEKYNIEISEHYGFCFGVRRAINIVEQGLSKYKKLFSVGPLIHNPQIVHALKQKGLKVVSDFNHLCKYPFVISSHGLELNKQKELEEKNIVILDTTCPYVKKAQEYISDYETRGYSVAIFGDSTHQEVIGLNSYSKNGAILFEDIKELPNDLERFQEIVVLSQTTKAEKDYFVAVAELKKRAKKVVVLNTICKSTQIRQKNAKELAKNNDIVVIIGGKNSANTKMLEKIAKSYTKTVHIETEKDLSQNDFVGIKSIGITSGASTPREIVKKVYNKIEEMLSK